MQRKLSSGLSALLVLLFGAATLLAAPQAEGELPWESDVDKAIEKAKELKKPIMICMHWDQEKACRAMLKSVYTNPAVQNRMKDFVLIGTAPDIHDEVTVKTKTGEKQVSAWFGTVSCDVLVKNEHRVKELWFDSPKVIVPQHIFVGLDGKVFLKKTYQLDPAGFKKLMKDAMETFTGEASKTLDARIQKYMKIVKKGDDKERKEAIRGIIENGDKRTIEWLFHTIESIGKEKDRAKCIRAMGYEDLSAAGPILERWLDDDSNFIKNCAVVSLEETKHSEAVPKLLTLLEKTKDKELRKDIIRALGPCADGDRKAQEAIISHRKSRSEKERKAVYLSLGYGLTNENEEARDALVLGYKREGKSLLQKVPILMSFHRSGDEELLPSFTKMMKGEKNGQLVILGEKVAKKLHGEGGEFGRGDYKLFISVFADDKIRRNIVQDWIDARGGKGGRGGGGRGGRGGR